MSEIDYKQLRLLVLDVDGVLSNGLLIYGNNGEEMKTFHTEDGLGIKLLQRSGIEVAIITGRDSAIVARRGHVPVCLVVERFSQTSYGQPVLGSHVAPRRLTTRLP